MAPPTFDRSHQPAFGEAQPSCEVVSYGNELHRRGRLKTKEEVMRILGRELPYLSEKYGVVKFGLFGSYSSDEQDVESDIDLLVQFDRPIGFFKFIAVEDYLKDKLGEKVELVTEDALKPVIKPRIMQECVYVQVST